MDNFLVFLTGFLTGQLVVILAQLFFYSCRDFNEDLENDK